jgi:hypothetical protein
MPITLAEEQEEQRILAGTPNSPAWCDGCLNYAKVYNVCRHCGRDERARYGCRHRLGIGDICNECRADDIRTEGVAKLTADAETLKAVLLLLDEFCRVKLVNNRVDLLALQLRGIVLLEQLKGNTDAEK